MGGVLPGCGSVFTTRQVLDAGLAVTSLRAKVARGEWVTLLRGVHASAETVEGALRAEPARCSLLAAAAALYLRDDTVAAAGEAAAVLHGLPIHAGRIDPVRLLRRDGPACRLRTSVGAVVVGRPRPPRRQAAAALSVPATPVAVAVVDIARQLSAPAALITADAALRRGLTSRTELLRVIREQHPAHGLHRAHRVVMLADARSESPLESLSRAHFAAVGLEAPDLQVDLHDDVGGFVGRADFYWRASRVVGEADGLSKYVDPAVLRAEKLRQERIERTGCAVVRWTWQEIERDPYDVVVRIRRAMQRPWRAGARGAGW